jgi:hypothetical protein
MISIVDADGVGGSGRTPVARRRHKFLLVVRGDPVGMPLTPVSVAGVARRTTRRTVRRMAY